MKQWKIGFLVAAALSMTGVAANAQQGHKLKILMDSSIKCYWIWGEAAPDSKAMPIGPAAFIKITPRNGWIDTPYTIKYGGLVVVNRYTSASCGDGTTLRKDSSNFITTPGNDGLTYYWLKNFK